MNVVIIDDDRLVTNSLKTIIESDPNINVVDVGNNGNDAISLYTKLKPNVLLMDIRMNELNGINAAKQILSLDKNAKILFLTTFEDDEYITKAINIGVKGYILKQDFESIIPSLKAVYLGQTVFAENIVSKLQDICSKEEKVDLDKFNLTQREIQIIKLISNGLNNKEISNNLYISEGTVRNTISTILEKLNLRDRTQIAIFYHTNCKK